MEFKIKEENATKIHNAYAALCRFQQNIDGVLNARLTKQLRDAIKQLEAGFKEVRDDIDALDAGFTHKSESLKMANKFVSYWSIPRTDFTTMPEWYIKGHRPKVLYSPSFGINTILMGHTYLDLWHAAEVLITTEGGDHVFIENFTIDPRDSDVLILSTGS